VLNNVSIAGRITKDAETKQFDNSSITRFTLAVERPKYKDKEKETDFIDCSIWNADKLAPHLTKGKPIAVIGELQTRGLEDKNGNKRKAAEVKVDRVSFLPDSKRDRQAPAQSNELEDVPFTEDELPF